jgi:regulatory protein YycI of two-component signal transduction system YycFG
MTNEIENIIFAVVFVVIYVVLVTLFFKLKKTHEEIENMQHETIKKLKQQIADKDAIIYDYESEVSK